MALTARELATAVGIDLLIAIVCFGVFSQLRVKKVSRKFYSPRRFQRREGKRKPKRLPNSVLGWVKPLITGYTEDELLEVAGTDAIMYLRVITFGFELMVWLLLVVPVIVVPANLWGGSEVNRRNRVFCGKPGRGGGTDCDKAPLSDLDKVSMANIESVLPDSQVMWVHTVAMWLVAFIVMRLLNRYTKEAVALRIRHMANEPKGADSHSVLVTDVPGIQYGTYVQRAYEAAIGPLHWLIPAKMKARMKDRVLSLGRLGTGVTNGTLGAFSQRTVGKVVQRPAADTITVDKGDAEAGFGQVRAFFDAQDHFVNLQDPKLDKVERLRELDNWRFVHAMEVTDMNPWRKALQALEHSEPNDVIHHELDQVYPGLVRAVNTVYDQSRLEGMVAKYDALVRSTEDVLDQYVSRLRRRAYNESKHRKKSKIFPALGASWVREKYGTSKKAVKVDTLEYNKEVLDRLYHQIEEEGRAVRDAGDYTSTAFVTFQTRRAATICATAMHHHDEATWRTSAAPDSRELIWHNLKYRAWERNVRFALVWAAFVAMCFFYLPPVAAIQGIFNYVPTVRPFKDVFNVPVLGGVLEGIVPGLALKIFLAIVPMIIAALNRFQGMVSLSAVSFGVVRKYFLFQVIVVFIYTFIAGSLSEEAKKLIDKPSSILTLLGTGVPQQASFFVSYVLVNALIVQPIKFLRIPAFVIFYIRSKLAGTDRAKNRLWQDQPMKFGSETPDHTIVLLLVLVFAVVQPVILLVGLLYFVTNTITWRYNMAYVFVDQFQSGGRMWMVVQTQVIVGLFISQLSMIGFMAIKKFPGTPALVPLPIITLIFYGVTQARFSRPLKVLSLRAACDLDRLDEDHEADRRNMVDPQLLEEEEAAIRRNYLSPVFKVDEEKHALLLREIDDVGARVEKYNQKKVTSGGKEKFYDASEYDPSPSSEDDDVDTPAAVATTSRNQEP